jgi:hypothetical protein
VRDPGALADRLVHILSSPELAHRMGVAARARVETLFSLRASVATAERALEELLVGGRSGALREDVAEVGPRHA